MCNLSEGVRDLGRAEGFLASIRSLMANTGWPLEKRWRYWVCRR